MSRLARKPIIIPQNVKIELKKDGIEVNGPLGKLSQSVSPEIKVIFEDNKIFVNRIGNARQDKMFQGLTWSLIRNMVIGVTNGFKKELEIRGVGFGSQVSGSELIIRVGFSHPVKYKIPDGIKIATNPKGVLITVSGIDKYLVGETSAQIRRIKPPEPYKGMGIRYLGEKVIKKAGKTAMGVGAAGAPAKK